MNNIEEISPEQKQLNHDFQTLKEKYENEKLESENCNVNF